MVTAWGSVGDPVARNHQAGDPGRDRGHQHDKPVTSSPMDSAGNLYTVAAFDPEDSVPDPDNGPFRSVVFKIGQVVGGEVELDVTPTIQATVDGLKVESVAVREDNDHVDLFIGTHDENYGGTLRLLPPLDLP